MAFCGIGRARGAVSCAPCRQREPMAAHTCKAARPGAGCQPCPRIRQAALRARIAHQPVRQPARTPAYPGAAQRHDLFPVRAGLVCIVLACTAQCDIRTRRFGAQLVPPSTHAERRCAHPTKHTAAVYIASICIAQCDTCMRFLTRNSPRLARTQNGGAPISQSAPPWFASPQSALQNAIFAHTDWMHNSPRLAHT